MNNEAEADFDTYCMEVRDNPRHAWPNWVLAVHNSLAAGEWIGRDNFPPYAQQVFNMVKAEQKIKFADSR